MKPGYKSTEFYFTAASYVVGLLWASGFVSDGGQVDKVLGFIAMALGQLGYSVSRGMVKSKALPAPPA